MTTSRTWSQIADRLRAALAPEEYSTWIAPLRVKSESRDELVLAAPNARFVHTVEESYRHLLDREAAAVRDELLQVFLTTDDSGDEPRPAAADAPERSNLNPKYRFDTFVVGNSNQFAHAAARAVAESPSHSYNPLFLYGGVGLGKTHLLHAIGHHVAERHPRAARPYLTAEQFVNELIDSMRFNRMHAFRERYRSGRRAAGRRRPVPRQQGAHAGGVLPHLQHALQRARSRSSSPPTRSPRNIPALEERLRSRFEWGLIADIQPPDLETKVAILRRKADLDEPRDARRRRPLHRQPGALERARARGDAHPGRSPSPR